MRFNSTISSRFGNSWTRFAGDVIYVRVFGNPVIVLNSAEAVSDLFEKRSANYSSRPVRTMVNELCARSM